MAMTIAQSTQRIMEDELEGGRTGAGLFRTNVLLPVGVGVGVGAVLRKGREGSGRLHDSACPRFSAVQFSFTSQ